MENYTTIIVTALTAIGSTGAWTYYQNRMKLNYESKKEDKSEQNLYRDDLRERVTILETKLDEERNAKQKTTNEVIELRTKLTEYKVRLEFLEKESIFSLLKIHSSLGLNKVSSALFPSVMVLFSMLK